MITTERVPVWDAMTSEWRTITVEIPPAPRRRRTRKRGPVKRGHPRDTSGLSDTAPIPAWWRDTAYADMGPLADMRSWVKPSAMRTHRPAAVMPADPGQLTARKPSDRLDV